MIPLAQSSIFFNFPERNCTYISVRLFSSSLWARFGQKSILQFISSLTYPYLSLAFFSSFMGHIRITQGYSLYIFCSRVLHYYHKCLFYSVAVSP